MATEGVPRCTSQGARVSTKRFRRLPLWYPVGQINALPRTSVHDASPCIPAVATAISSLR
jgi:hypothetical protein